MDLRPLSYYVRELKPVLGREVFAPATSRLLWLPAYLTVIVTLTIAVASGWLPWQLWPLASLAIGFSFAGTTFLGHETAHGAVVKGRRLKHAITFVCFLPFTLSPRLWKVWHNAVHHGNTQRPIIDPDVYPTLGEYRASQKVQAVTDHFALGGRRWTGIFSLLIGFTIQSTNILRTADRLGMSTSARRAALAETLAGVALWATVAWLVGPLAFLFVFALPLVVANVTVMSYILTNHGLSPLTGDVNDPLVNSLSVTVSPAYDWLTLGFGYHTEHHLFPAMSTRHAPRVKELLLQRWPERYQSMPLGDALLVLHRTGRVYKDDVTLHDPVTGGEWPALQPGHPSTETAHAAAAAPADAGERPRTRPVTLPATAPVAAP